MIWSLRHLVIGSFIVISGLGFGVCEVHAIADPLGVPNNRFGVHILEPTEIGEAAKLVNSNGGDWGYVTIPMRSNDRDYFKWYKFFESAKALHVIPIIRIATYPINNIWETPTVYDLVDFANFLNDMPWSTKNRYIVLFNEPNHANEWGGQVNPYGYARLLVDAKQIFKSRSQDYFLLTAGLDMSSANTSSSEDALLFYKQMTAVQPDWYLAIDGLAVHAYSNPGFSASPYSQTRYGITSYRFEESTLAKLGLSGKPIFITETGTISQNDFYQPAFSQIWTDANIIAITPFVLSAGGDFSNFSLVTSAGHPKKSYSDILSLPKITGSPLLANIILTASPTYSSQAQLSQPNFIHGLTNFWQKIIGLKSNTLQIGNTNINITVADNDLTRAQGLSGKDKLAINEGMLFKFQKASFWQFWMKDMTFALDFVWIKDGKIVELTQNVAPPSKTNNQPQILTPRQPVDQVLEVDAGFISAHNLQIGDSVVIN